MTLGKFNQIVQVSDVQLELIFRSFNSAMLRIPTGGSGTRRNSPRICCNWSQHWINKGVIDHSNKEYIGFIKFQPCQYQWSYEVDMFLLQTKMGLRCFFQNLEDPTFICSKRNLAKTREHSKQAGFLDVYGCLWMCVWFKLPQVHKSFH